MLAKCLLIVLLDDELSSLLDFRVAGRNSCNLNLIPPILTLPGPLSASLARDVFQKWRSDVRSADEDLVRDLVQSIRLIIKVCRRNAQTAEAQKVEYQKVGIVNKPVKGLSTLDLKVSLWLLKREQDKASAGRFALSKIDANDIKRASSRPSRPVKSFWA